MHQVNLSINLQPNLEHDIPEPATTYKLTLRMTDLPNQKLSHKEMRENIFNEEITPQKNLEYIFSDDPA